MRFRHGITVTVHRDNPGGVDQYGDPIPGTVQTFNVQGCAVSPRSAQPGSHSKEIIDYGRMGVIEGVTLYAPFGTDIRRTDRIELPAPWNGVFEVEGEPGAWRNPFTGWEAGLEVALRRVEG